MKICSIVALKPCDKLFNYLITKSGRIKGSRQKTETLWKNPALSEVESPWELGMSINLSYDIYKPHYSEPLFYYCSSMVLNLGDFHHTISHDHSCYIMLRLESGEKLMLYRTGNVWIYNCILAKTGWVRVFFDTIIRIDHFVRGFSKKNPFLI